MYIENFEEKALKVSELLKVIGHEKRLMILCKLSSGEKSVSEMEELLGMSQSMLSQHLTKLRAAQVVKTRRYSQMVYYSIASSEITTLIQKLGELYGEQE